MMETRNGVEKINNEVRLQGGTHIPSNETSSPSFKATIDALKSALTSDPLPTVLKLDFSTVMMDLSNLAESKKSRTDHYLMTFQAEVMAYITQQLQTKVCALEELCIEGWQVKDKKAQDEKTNMLQKLGNALRTNQKLHMLSLKGEFSNKDLPAFVAGLSNNYQNNSESMSALKTIIINDAPTNTKTATVEKSPMRATPITSTAKRATTENGTQAAKQPKREDPHKKAITYLNRKNVTIQKPLPIEPAKTTSPTNTDSEQPVSHAIHPGVDTADNLGADVQHIVRVKKSSPGNRPPRDLSFFAFSALLGATAGTIIGGLVTLFVAGIGVIAEAFIGNATLLTVLGVGLTASGIGVAVGLAILAGLVIAGAGYCLYKAEEDHQQRADLDPQLEDRKQEPKEMTSSHADMSKQLGQATSPKQGQRPTWEDLHVGGLADLLNPTPKPAARDDEEDVMLMDDKTLKRAPRFSSSSDDE